MIRVACAMILVAGFTSLAIGDEKTKTGFVDKTFKNADGTTSPYVVFVPKDYDGTKEYPVILFLHGAGETKQPNAKKEGKMPVEVGIGPAIKKREKDFPFIVVIPRAEGFGWAAGSANAKRALAMLDEVQKEYKTDPKRAEKLKELPIWAFHGDADMSVNVSGSRDMIEAIKKAGGMPKYTEYPK